VRVCWIVRSCRSGRCARPITEEGNKSRELRLKNFFPLKEPRGLGNESSFSSLLPAKKSSGWEINTNCRITGSFHADMGPHAPRATTFSIFRILRISYGGPLHETKCTVKFSAAAKQTPDDVVARRFSRRVIYARVQRTNLGNRGDLCGPASR